MFFLHEPQIELSLNPWDTAPKPCPHNLIPVRDFTGGEKKDGPTPRSRSQTSQTKTTTAKTCQHTNTSSLFPSPELTDLAMLESNTVPFQRWHLQARASEFLAMKGLETWAALSNCIREAGSQNSCDKVETKLNSGSSVWLSLVCNWPVGPEPQN